MGFIVVGTLLTNKKLPVDYHRDSDVNSVFPRQFRVFGHNFSDDRRSLDRDLVDPVLGVKSIELLLIYTFLNDANAFSQRPEC